jgi:hypothetical protein
MIIRHPNEMLRTEPTGLGILTLCPGAGDAARRGP